MVLESASVRNTFHIAENLAKNFKKKDVILLSGELGAGKTTFIKGICKAKGIPPREITSPSFVILNIYYGQLKIFHFDFFRLTSSEIIELGIYDYLEQEALFLIEWPQKAEGILERRDIEVELKYLDLNRRQIIFKYFSRRGKRILEEFKKTLK